MKGKLKNLKGIPPCLFEIAIGILLLMNPEGFTKGIITAFGIALIIISVVCIIKYFKCDLTQAAEKQYLLKGLLAIAAGGFCVIKSDWFIVTFPALTILYGIAVLVMGLSKLQLTVDLLRRKNQKWYLAVISAVISIICAVIILNNPFSTTKFLWMFTGISLIAESVLDIITLVICNKETNSIETQTEAEE